MRFGNWSVLRHDAIPTLRFGLRLFIASAATRDRKGMYVYVPARVFFMYVRARAPCYTSVVLLENGHREVRSQV